MKYRCPYCGEPAFSTAERLGVPVGGIGKSAVWVPKCPHCKRTVCRSSTEGMGRFRTIMATLLSVMWIPLFCLLLTVDRLLTGYTILLMILLLLVGYGGMHYFFLHFDKYKPQQMRDPRFTMTTNTDERIPIRVGEIYVCRLLDRNPSNEVPQVIGLVHRIRKEEGKKMITLRIIRCDDADLPTPDERVRVLTDGRFDVEGNVIDVPVEIEI